MLKQNIKEKAFILPSTIVSMVIITLFSILMLTMVITTTNTNRVLQKKSNKKIECEQIIYAYKNNKISQLDENIEIFTYNCEENANISAIIAKKNDNVICFFIYDEVEGTICYQTENYVYEFDENDKLIYYDLTFAEA